MNIRFSGRQRQVLTLCALMYMTAYLCRLTLSAALSGVMQALNLSMARGGMLQTVFAVIYASGQLVNGSLVDRVNPVRHLLLGLLGSALCNLAMGLCASYPAMLAVWSINAVFQSMMWTPVVRLLALYFQQQRERERANAVIAFMLIAGHFAAWAVSGFVSACSGWRLSFIAPAVIAFLVCAAMLPLMRGLDVSRQEAAARSQRPPHASSVQALLSTGFFFVLIACVLYGFIRDSVVTWAPTILSGISGGDAISSAAYPLILPAINVLGVTLGVVVTRRGARPYSVVILMMGAAILCSAALLCTGGMLVTAALLGMICAAMYGANPMLTGLIPLEYDRIGKTSLTAGLIDSMIYAGSALAGVCSGSIFENRGAQMLYIFFILAGAASAVLMLLSRQMSSAYWTKNRE